MYYNRDCKIHSMFMDATDKYYHQDKYCLLNCTRGCQRKSELQDIDKHNQEVSKWFHRIIKA
jgi:tRNA 2-selenouridine synthase SelU